PGLPFVTVIFAAASPWPSAAPWRRTRSSQVRSVNWKAPAALDRLLCACGSCRLSDSELASSDLKSVLVPAAAVRAAPTISVGRGREMRGAGGGTIGFDMRLGYR